MKDLYLVIFLRTHRTISGEFSKNKCSIEIEMPDYREKFNKLYINDVFTNESTFRKVINKNLSLFKERLKNTEALQMSVYAPRIEVQSELSIREIIEQEIVKIIKGE